MSDKKPKNPMSDTGRTGLYRRSIYRAIRGGDWRDLPFYLRPSLPNDSLPWPRNHYDGFRLARTIKK